MSNKIKCPKCKASFEMTDAVEQDLRAQLAKEYEGQAEELKAQLDTEREKLTAERTSIDKEVTRRLEANKKAFQAQARDAAEAELTAIREENEATTAKLREAQKNEVELRKAQRQLEQEKNEFQLKMTRELDAERSKIVEEVSRKTADDYQMKELEWNKQRTDMLKQMDELRRKAEVGSQQAQGEVLELEIENLLREAFPHDSIEPVAKGVMGGDILQVVNTNLGARCGAILWELKRTKSFSDTWIPKLKDDQRNAKADLSVLVTTAMPKGVERIGQVDGVWVAEVKSMLGIALALRASLVEVARTRTAQEGRKTKAEEVYTYINGVEFRGRIQALVETFVAMKEDLDTERRSFDKVWAKREKQLVRVLGTTAGLYGELQGLVGASLPEIKALTMDIA